MSSIKITNISNRNEDGGPIISGISTISGTGASLFPSGSTSQRVGVESGSIRYNNSIGVIEFYDGSSWIAIDNTTRERGIFAGGATPTYVTTIDYVNIGVLSDAKSFGSLTQARSLAACSSSTRGVFGGGFNPTVTPSGVVNTIDYITIASTGNAIDFGDLTVTRTGLSGCSSSTRGVFGGGFAPVPALTQYNVIDYITIASTGNAIDFGDLTVARSGLAACSSSTRGVFGGGIVTPVVNNTIDYITIASTGNAIDFGDLTVARNALAACSSSTRGVFGGGVAPALNNTIDYITIASTGNAIDFGDLTIARHSLAACSSSTRGVFGGGYIPTAPTPTNTIDYITIASTGNATGFGSLSQARAGLAACSDSHGGIS